MSKLDELITELCPNGVEYKDLCDISKMSAGDRITTAMMSDDKEFPVMGAGLVPTGYFHDWNRENTITISRAGVGAGSVGWHPEKFWATDVCFTVEHNNENVDIKYLFYAVKSQEKNRTSHMYGGSMPKIDKNYLWHLRIPVPPIEVQREIVRILDNLTEFTVKLTAELTAELIARKKQYEYYRNMLFQKTDNVPKKALVEVADISRGVRVVKKQLNIKGEYPVYQNCLAPMGYFDKANCDANTTYVISAGAAGEVGFSDREFWAADDCLVFSKLNGLMNKYIYYFLLTKSEYIHRNVRKASIPRLSRTVIEKLEIPMISIEQQEKIVDILDRFDVLCADISNGLPSEIEARQKQYEYYRDKLLSFKELGV